MLQLPSNTKGSSPSFTRQPGAQVQRALRRGCPALPRPWNPLRDHAGLGRYLAATPAGLQPALDGGTPATADERAIHERLHSKILERDFPCVAARSVLNRGTYRFGAYGALGSDEAALALCHDLYEFTHEFPAGQPSFTSLMAAFPVPEVRSEAQFEELLWQQLQRMHDIDARFFDWDGSVSRDPDDDKFSFSIGGRAFFVVGLNRCASRQARACPASILVFNPHDQFETLRAGGKYEQLQQAIRRRDIAYQGSVNPMLEDFGERSESRQYSGRAVPAEWRCPFHAHARTHATSQPQPSAPQEQESQA